MTTHSFFKPYRQRIHEMVQHHDSLDNDPEDHQPNQPHFGYSPQHENQRNNKSPYRYDSPQQKRSMRQYNFNNTRKHTKLERQMQEPIWDHLYNQGLRIQKDIMQIHNQKKYEIDRQCTFQPMIRKSSRYRIPTSSNFLERNYQWQENKLEKIVKQKEEEVIKGLQNCTFKPKLNNYKPRSNKYHHMNPSKSMINLKKEKNFQDFNKSKSRAKEKEKQETKEKQRNPGFNKDQVGKIKNIIRSELKRIQL